MEQRASGKWKFLIVLIASFRSDSFAASIEQDILNGIDDIIPDCVLGADNVDYYLFNRNNPDGLVVNWTSEEIPVIKNITTVFLVHGFTSEANTSQYLNLTHAMVEKNDVNVFAVDWAEGACTDGGISLTRLLSFPSAARNTRKVGEDMSKFIGRLIKDYGMMLEDIQLVGHSLGAQVVSFAGKDLEKRGIRKPHHILALDPAGPTFEDRPCSERICATDAHFVQVFHTSYALGMHQPVGDVDFYFNGGENQPSCSLLNRIVCSHSSAIAYLNDIVQDPKCNFVGRKWDRSRWNVPKFACSEDTCSVPGALASELPARGSFYIDTSDLPSVCVDFS